MKLLHPLTAMKYLFAKRLRYHNCQYLVSAFSLTPEKNQFKVSEIQTEVRIMSQNIIKKIFRHKIFHLPFNLSKSNHRHSPTTAHQK